MNLASIFLLLLWNDLGVTRALSKVKDDQVQDSLAQGSSQKRWQTGKKVPDVSQDKAFVAAANKVVLALDSLLPSSQSQQAGVSATVAKRQGESEQKKQKHAAAEVRQPPRPLEKGSGCRDNRRERKKKPDQGASGTDGGDGTDFFEIRCGRVLSSNARSKQQEGEDEDLSGGLRSLFGDIGRRARYPRDPSFDELVSGRIPTKPTSLLDFLAGSTGGSASALPLLPGAAELLRSPGSPEATEALEIISASTDLTASIFETLHNLFEIIEYSLELLHRGAFLFLDPALWITRLQQAANEGLTLAESQTHLAEIWSSLLSVLAERLQIVSTGRENFGKLMEQLSSSESLLRSTLERFLPKEEESIVEFSEQLRNIFRGGSEEGGSGVSREESQDRAGGSSLYEDARSIEEDVQRGVLEGVRSLEEELSRSEEAGVERLVEALRSGLEEVSSMLTEAASRAGEEALKRGAEAALKSLEEALSLYIETVLEGAREAGKRVIEGTEELGKEARELAEEVQREALKEIVKLVVEVLRSGVEEVRKVGEEGRELGKEAGMEVSKEVAKRAIELLKKIAEQAEDAGEDGADSVEEAAGEATKTAAEEMEGAKDGGEENVKLAEEEGSEAVDKAVEQGEKAGEEGSSLAEEVSREVAERAEEAFKRGFEEAVGRVSEGEVEGAEQTGEEKVSAGIDEAVSLVEQVLQRGLEETIAAGDRGAEEGGQGLSETTYVAKVLLAASEEASHFPRVGKDAERVAEHVGEALAAGLANWREDA